MTSTSPAPISTMPPASSSSPSNANANNNPISPVSRSSTFAHKTSPAVATQTPLIDTNTPAINAAPVELDGVPTDKETLARRGTGGSNAASGVGVVSPVDGEGGEDKAKRQAMLASRSNDPGVIVDLPSLPTAEEVEAAKSAEGTLTPAALPSMLEHGRGIVKGDDKKETKKTETKKA